jgi:pimeloyl-ACP methyl ester carboxylesterase
MRVSVNGVRLFFEVEGAKFYPDGPNMRERPTLLLLHGGPGMDHSTFMPGYSRVSSTAQVIYLDHRGNGRSERGDPGSWQLENWADDVKGFCDALEPPTPQVILDGLGSKQKMLEVFENSGHFVHLSEPDRFFTGARSEATHLAWRVIQPLRRRVNQPLRTGM